MDSTTITPLPDDIAALFVNTRQATFNELSALEKAATAIREDPQFISECSKALAEEEILRSVEETGLNLGTFATKF